MNGHESVGVGIHWDEGALVNPWRALIGAADLSQDSISTIGLDVRAAPISGMGHHAELIGWPQGDDEDAKLKRIDLATDLATASFYVER
ncbi:MAG: hypothetical protein IJQ73_15290 [Kiritimatiellae bacterium]|nr:hypothetical protein [Kiritimatiellia bacterium]